MGGLAGVISDPRQGSNGGFDDGPEADDKKTGPATEEEKAAVRKFWKQYNDARKFDEAFRKQIAVDRKYAAGTSDMSWAVTTNLIGAFIDILVSIIYARDPDVSVRKSPQVDESGTRQMELFARTLEIVISMLWKKGKLKKAARKGVRSVLSNSEGWFKCTMVSEKEPRPEIETALNDAREAHERLEAQMKLLADPESNDPDTMAYEKAEKQALIDELEEKLEVAINRLFVIDFVATENIQVSIDVATVSDYLDANWIANEQFMEKDEALTSFEVLTPEDLKSAKLFYQRQPKDLTSRDQDASNPQGQISAESASAFTTSSGGSESPGFVRVIEQWDRRDKQIRTSIDGVERWAKEPYAPPYPTSRFYPYFFFCFYEVDGARHPQSLAWRLYKLQDEYSAARSNFRLTRERSIPGVLFNATLLDETEARKLEGAKHQEYTALRPSDPTQPLANVFAAKPVANIDMRIFDPTLILSDMERLSGVQEALSAAINGPGNPRTATEANIQQSGTNARTSADRDALEEMLSDMARYTAEQALQCIPTRDVQRLAGPKAFWPIGMDIEDLFTLVEVQITAGTTGKPRTGMDSQAWATILPLIQKMLGDIRGAFAHGDVATANSLIELVKETMLRLGDESDVERFIPRTPPPGSPGAGAPPAPIIPDVKVQLKGEISPVDANALVQPVVTRDALSQPPPQPPGGPLPAPGPAGPASPSIGPGGPAPAPALAPTPAAGPH
jgi:hypothetical protein